MSISKDNENQTEEHDCCATDSCAHQQPESHDLRVVMKQLEENNTIPEGFVMVFMFGDPEESQDNTQTDFFFRAVAESHGLKHKKLVMMYQDTPITRHDLAWFGDWNKLADMAESTEAIIGENLTRFVKEGSLSQMPRMDFMFANQGTPDDVPDVNAEDEDLF
tara:strand:+ start:53 stop:541 length:489 start_codon:yes stop_codon:yes gene_type:complete